MAVGMDDLTPDRKTILSDPVGSYRDINGESGSSTTIAELNKLDAICQDLRRQQKSLLDTTKSLSRKIGDARRRNLSLDDLLASMQEQSARLKDVAGKLSVVEHTILDYFSNLDTVVTRGMHHRAPANDLPHRVHRAAATYSEGVTISLLGSDTHDWNNYVDENPDASIYHRAEWKDLIFDTFGHKGIYFMAQDNNGKVAGILPLIHIKSRLFGNFLVSMPYFNYGGAIADHPHIEHELIHAANDHAASLDADHVEYRDDINRDWLPVSMGKVNMLLALPDSGDTLWHGFSPKLRAQIRRPQYENPDVILGGVECLDDFYDVFSRNMRDLGTPVYSKVFFRNILERFPDRCRLLIIGLHGRPVAAGFLTGHKDTLEIPWASTIRQVNHLSMNMLLYWSALNFAIEQHYKYFDFGRSSRDSGTYRFKQQWGAQPRQLYWHYWLKQGNALPSLNPGNPKYAMAIATWRRLPLWITKYLGPPIVKYIP
jgi:FemAB-related protein (PEP-CTERM system-associated)